MTRTKNLALMLVSVAMLLVAGSWLVLRLVNPPFVPQPLPVPNGYDDILRAAEMIGPGTQFYDEMNPEKLAAIVAMNKPAMVLAHDALEKESAVPLDWSADDTWLAKVHFPRTGKPRRVARAFAAAALVAHRNGERQAAIDFGSDNIRLGQAITKGGLLVDWQVGHAIYGLGLQVLRDEIGSLSRRDCESLLQQVGTQETSFDSLNDIIERELAFYHATHSAIESFIIRSVQNRQLKLTRKQMEETDAIYSVTKEILLTHLAIRLFQLDENRLPNSLDELVPKYLPAVPQDPFFSGPLIYRPNGESYLLYSVGPNKQDDGGVEQNSFGRADVLLEPREIATLEATADN